MKLKQIAEVKFPTRWATFRLLGFEAWRTDETSGKSHKETALALVLGDIQSEPPLVRIHSQCLTGEVFHSLRCDCRDQLELALYSIARRGSGVVLYEQQEGRGIGLAEKLRAYELQDRGLDTIEANLRLGHPIDLRDYALSIEVLGFLKIRSLRLMSNNPDKIDAVKAAGIRIVERIAADTAISPHAEAYVETKRQKLGHLSSAAVAKDSDGSNHVGEMTAYEPRVGRTSPLIGGLAFATLGSRKQ